jgi:hypothetical protein
MNYGVETCYLLKQIIGTYIIIYFMINFINFKSSIITQSFTYFWLFNIYLNICMYIYICVCVYLCSETFYLVFYLFFHSINSLYFIYSF